MIKFISYTGKYPALCKGTLTLQIDGELVSFQPFNGNISIYEKFWFTGGKISYDEDWRWTKGPWFVDKNVLPDKYKKYADELEVIVNKHIPQGCCGGCIKVWN